MTVPLSDIPFILFFARRPFMSRCYSCLKPCCSSCWIFCYFLLFSHHTHCSLSQTLVALLLALSQFTVLAHCSGLLNGLRTRIPIIGGNHHSCLTSKCVGLLLLVDLRCILGIVLADHLVPGALVTQLNDLSRQIFPIHGISFFKSLAYMCQSWCIETAHSSPSVCPSTGPPRYYIINCSSDPCCLPDNPTAAPLVYQSMNPVPIE